MKQTIRSYDNIRSNPKRIGNYSNDTLDVIKGLVFGHYSIEKPHGD